MHKSKELVVKPTKSISDINGFLSNMRRSNVKLLYLDPRLVVGKDFKTIYPSDQADIVICETIEELRRIKILNKSCGFAKKVYSNDDLDEIVTASAMRPGSSNN